MADSNELFGYGTGYVPQVETLIKAAEKHIPDILLDYFMDMIYKDSESQGINLRDDDSDEKMDIVMEAASDVAYGWLEKVRAAAKSRNEDDLHYMLLPF